MDRQVKATLAMMMLSSALSLGDVIDWDITKGAYYRQSDDTTAPSNPEGWFVAIAICAGDAGDASAATIERQGSGNPVPLAPDDEGWSLLSLYESEAAMNEAFPSDNIYTLTLSGGTLGQVTQTVMMGSANYPEVPYLTESDFSRIRTIDAEAPFTLHWSSAGTATNVISLELTEKLTLDELSTIQLEGTATSHQIASDTMEPGYCYEGLLFFQNRSSVSGEGGFGVTGYAQHARVLLFDFSTVLSPNVAPIVGAWQFGDGAADQSGILLFQADGTFFNATDDAAEPGASDGMERGTYIWNQSNGELFTNVEIDTNGIHGLSHPNGLEMVTVSGDSLTITDESGSSLLKRVQSKTNPLIGGWRLCDNQTNNTGVIVFLDNGYYFQAAVNDGNPTGSDGMERGAFNWDPTSSALTATPALDTNGTLGLSHPETSFTAEVLGRRVLKMADQGEELFHRVSNAAVLVDWRLLRSRDSQQISDNTPPMTPSSWSIWSQLETRNPGDATSATISGGGISGALDYEQDGKTWTLERDYATEDAINTEFPSSATYTITLSGGDLGTVTQTLSLQNSLYPPTPYLTGTDWTDVMAIDATLDLELNWNAPGSPPSETASTGVALEIWKRAGDGELQEYFWLDNGQCQVHTVPAQTLTLDENYLGYLEFEYAEPQSGEGGFGINGLSAHLSSVDFNMTTLNTAALVLRFTESAGLTGNDALVTAAPFGEGVSNLLKYAFNLEASEPALHFIVPGVGLTGLPIFTFDRSGQEPTVRVEYLRRKGAGLIYIPKVSTLLAPESFTPMQGEVTVNNIDEQWERIVITEPYPPLTPRLFGKVDVTIP